MADILSQIMAVKREEVAAAQRRVSFAAMRADAESRVLTRDFEGALRRKMAAGQAAEARRFRLVEPEDRTSYRSIQYYDDNTLNVCLPATYRFVDTVVDALADMHRQAGTPGHRT